MPGTSRFLGIVVRMHFADHRPPHFHAWYGEHQVLIAIDGPRVLRGQLPPRALGLVMEWAATHAQELLIERCPALFRPTTELCSSQSEGPPPSPT